MNEYGYSIMVELRFFQVFPDEILFLHTTYRVYFSPFF